MSLHSFPEISSMIVYDSFVEYLISHKEQSGSLHNSLPYCIWYSNCSYPINTIVFCMILWYHIYIAVLSTKHNYLYTALVKAVSLTPSIVVVVYTVFWFLMCVFNEFELLFIKL